MYINIGKYSQSRLKWHPRSEFTGWWRGWLLHCSAKNSIWFGLLKVNTKLAVVKKGKIHVTEVWLPILPQEKEKIRTNEATTLLQQLIKECFKIKKHFFWYRDRVGHKMPNKQEIAHKSDTNVWLVSFVHETEPSNEKHSIWWLWMKAISY